MKILGMDSSGLVASVAVVEDGVLLAEYTTDYKKTHSQTLLPMLDEIKRMIDLDMGTIDAIATSAGPGSFTGLRIGAATVKGLGLALNKPIVEVSTLEGLAWNLWGTDRVVCPLMDARRNQVYTAAYEFVPTDKPVGKDSAAGDETTPGQKDSELSLCTLIPQEAMDVVEMIEKLNVLQRPVVFLGDGVPVYEGLIKTHCKVPYLFAPAGKNRQRAASVAALGAVYYAHGQKVTAAEHQPIYLRKSQAEREAEAKA